MSRVGFSPAGWNGAMKMPKRMRLMCPPSWSPCAAPGQGRLPLGVRLSARGGPGLLAGQGPGYSPARARRRTRSASKVRLFTVPSGRPRRVAISCCVRCSK